MRASLHKGTPTYTKLPHLNHRTERGGEGGAARCGCYLDGQLELLVLPLQLLRFRQGAGVDQAGVQHRLSIADPSQDLWSRTGAQVNGLRNFPRAMAFSDGPFRQRARYLPATGRVWVIGLVTFLILPGTLSHRALTLRINLIPSVIYSFLPLSCLCSNFLTHLI